MIRTWAEHPLASAYLERVCAQVKAKKVHEEIRLELINHLDELVAEGISEGLEEQEAVKQALSMLGDADAVGKQLHSAHKPLMEWSLLGIVAALVGVGLLAMYAMDIALSDSYGGGWFVKKAAMVMAGVLLLIAFYYIDFRKLRPYSWYLYGLGILLIFVTSQQGIEMNGQYFNIRIAGISFNAYMLSIYLFIISFAGVMTNSTAPARSRYLFTFEIVKHTIAFWAVPAWLYLISSAYLIMVIYVFGLMVVLMTVRNYRLLLIGTSFLLSMAALLVMSSSYKIHLTVMRLNAVLNFKNDPQGAGYATHHAIESIHSGGLWGQGLGTPNPKLPYVYSEMIFPYLIHSLGWFFGAFLLLLMLLLLFKIASLAQKLNDSYAKAITAGILAIIGFQGIWNILMSLGVLPMLGVSFPFVSYGLTGSVFELALMGLLLGLYRRKNMLGRASEASSHI
jgi:cell division protein FtsW (lipid II flippase)